MPDDLALLRAWRDGDASAGEALVAAHIGSIYRFFYNKVAAEQIDDLVQDTFEACVQVRDQFEGRSKFSTYLFTIARRRLYRLLNVGVGIDASTTSISELPTTVGTPAELLAEHQEQKLLVRGLRTLPLDQQVLLELSYWEGLSDRELAEVEGIPIGTLKSRLRASRLRLERALGELAASANLLDSTTENLEQWVAAMRTKR